ncbi:MAG: class I SAM-dependent methyltransferase [Acidobacteria bacterium]|nr:class I SAM-dependent methyltransferase [Acidobacteriota bacterium]
MEDKVEETYDRRCADVYDQWFGYFDEAAVDVLEELAGGGRALELGIGTGLVALPLAARGVEVHGIDASPEMVAALRAKPGGERLPVTMGDFADVNVEGEFLLVYVVYNTLFALQTQEEQVRCFRGVAARLAPGGAFVVEAFVPDLAQLSAGRGVRLLHMTDERVGIRVFEHDPVGQKLRSRHVVFKDGGTRVFPVEVRYAWPSELDLMARLAGLRLRARWGDWRRGAFGAQSEKHVSVYERPARAS